MTAQEIRNAYLKFCNERGHKTIARALLVPQNDPTTLFTGSGMQPLMPYLLGEEHPDGTRLVDSQTCLRAQDIEEVGDNRHTTFFEMMGNWSLGDYFKAEQLPWFWEFLTDIVGLDPSKLYVTCFIGNEKHGIPKDTESADIWKGLFAAKGIDAKTADIGTEDLGAARGMQPGERIFYYDADRNWWWRGAKIDDMPVGEPGGPDSEVFYEFDFVQHDPKWGEHCHPNCDCGRYMEIGNSVFMEYVKTANGFDKLPKKNVDFGGGLERIATAKIDSPDMFKISVIWPIIEKLEALSGKSYDSHTESMRVIADHLRAATFLAVDGVTPSNKTQGYVMRRLMRRAIRFAFELGVEQGLCEHIAPVVMGMYKADFPEVAEREQEIIATLIREEKAFRQTLRKGLREFNKLVDYRPNKAWHLEGEVEIYEKMSNHLTSQAALSENVTPIPWQEYQGRVLLGSVLFQLHDTFGFPMELSLEEAYRLDIPVAADYEKVFRVEMAQQKHNSQTAAKGTFKGGLADHSEITTKYHTATHLMYKALRIVLGDHVIQRGSNITAERLRFDFSHSEKVTPEQLAEVERIVNEQIEKDWPVSWREEVTAEVLGKVLGAFGDRYGDKVKIYTVGDPDGEHYSREICGGPHVEHTGTLAEGNKHFKIQKEEASSAGVRRIKAILA